MAEIAGAARLRHQTGEWAGLKTPQVLVAAAFLTLFAGYIGNGMLPLSLYDWPEAHRIPLQAAANDWLDNLLRRSVIWDQPLRMWTRSFGEILGTPMRFIQGALATGLNVKTVWLGGPVTLAPIPWLTVSVACAAAVWLAAGVRFGLFTFLTFLYFAVFGLWNEAMLTLASVLVIVVIGTLTGFAGGVLLWRYPRLEVIAHPVFDVMQTIPPFSYLVPVLVLFGFGPVAALVATLIFALPPMVKATAYALRRVPVSVIELAEMTGASFLQRLLKMFFSTARADILLGLNQLVMMSLAMVILASMIGAGGLGSEVLKALQSLRFGRGLEAGLAITLIAVVLYQFGHAIAMKRPTHLQAKNHKNQVIAIAAVVLSVIVAWALPDLRKYPEAWTLSSSEFWSQIIAWLNANWGAAFEMTRSAITFGVLRPLLNLLQNVGWAPALLSLVLFSFALDRPRLAALAAVVVVGIASIGYWQPAVMTLHLVFTGTLLSLLVGVPIGIWASSSSRVFTVADGIVTTLQTLPSFVYLIPIVMLLGPGDVAGVFAIAIYAMATTIRYVSHALKEVDRSVLEAADMFGASYWQTFIKVRLPLAWPGLLLALNQTLMMAVGMVVITSLIGTRGLELETIDAIARVEAGRSLVAGLAISALAILIDRFLTAAAQSYVPVRSTT
ncbi:ABC transporter permease [Aestuariivirga sp.]|uniref:ABC transporter permease n=1 Tax=Aestuariivirga sp. TaxID=2650926 RepID=UPI0039E43CCC